MTSHEFLALPVYGNTMKDILYAVAIFLGVLVGLKIIQYVIVMRLKTVAARTKTPWDDEIIDIVTTVRPRVHTLIALYAALSFIYLPFGTEKFIFIVFLVLITWEIVQVVQRLIGFAVTLRLAKTEDEKRKNGPVIRNVNLLAKIVIWIIALLLILQNLGINVTSVIAGLGIGGLAIALALQNVLGDLFSSFSIYFDKPFEVDDFIQVGDDSGTVKAIGLKTTRLETQQGEELVMANNELTSARIQNFGKMKRRRVVVTLGLEYDTPNDKLERLSGWLKHIVDEAPNVEFDRAHFKEFSASSLDVELVYYVTSPDYYTHMETRQAINLAVKEKFEKEGLGFAYPTQTLYVKK